MKPFPDMDNAYQLFYHVPKFKMIAKRQYVYLRKKNAICQ